MLVPFPPLNPAGLHVTLSETVIHIRAKEGLDKYLRLDDVRQDFEELEHSPSKRTALKEGMRELFTYDPTHKGEILIIPMSNVPPGKTDDRDIQIADRMELDLDWVLQRLIPCVILSPVGEWRQAILEHGKCTGCTRFVIMDPYLESTIVIVELTSGNDLMALKFEISAEGIPKGIEQLAPHILILKWISNVIEQLGDVKALYPHSPSEETVRFRSRFERGMEELISKLERETTFYNFTA